MSGFTVEPARLDTAACDLFDEGWIGPAAATFQGGWGNGTTAPAGC